MPNIFIYRNDLTGEWNAYGLEIATANQTPQLHQIVSTDLLLSVFTTLSIVDRDNALNIFAVDRHNGIDIISMPLYRLLTQNITPIGINPS
jgi:muconolactone delta-isomerase